MLSKFTLARIEVYLIHHIFIFSVFCLISCSGIIQKDLIPTMKECDNFPCSDSTSIFFKLLSFPDSLEIVIAPGTYVLYPSKIEDTYYIVLPDCQPPQLRVYRIPDFQYVKTITLPDQVTLCGGMYSFFSKDLNHWVLLDDDDEGYIYLTAAGTIRKLNIGEMLRKTGYQLDFNLSHHNQIFITHDSLLFIPIQYTKKIKPGRKSRRPYNAMVYEYASGQSYLTGDSLLTHWSESYYGLFHAGNRYFSDTSILYMYTHSPEIRRFHHHTKSSDVFCAKSRHHTQTTPAMPKQYTRDDLWTHGKVNGFYQHLVYHPDKKLYFRFYLLPIPSQVAEGVYSTLEDRRISVMVMDEDFNILSERLLPEQCNFISVAIPSPSGILINYGPLQSPNSTHLNLLEIEFHEDLYHDY